MQRSCTALAAMVALCPLAAQIPDITYTSAAAAASYLVGPNVQVSNATFSGDGRQLALFGDGTDKIGFSEGVALTTGDAQFAATFGNSNPGDDMPVNSNATDVDLNAINGPGFPKDAALLEFDILTTGNSLSIQYVFASDEYLQYVGSNYNDAFGFFVSGPGVNGPFSNGAVNIATVNGAPVSVNTVNPQSNLQFYIDNLFYSQGFLTEANALFQYDGHTVVMTASMPVQCNTTYHLKIGICNTNDHIYDSAVFLKRGTISSTYAPPGPLTIAPSPVCAGEEITLNVQGDPSWNYTWSTGQSGVGLQSVTTIANLNQNSYSVSAEYLPGCSLSVASPTAMLTVHNPANVPPQCLGVNGTGVYTVTTQVGDQLCFNIPTSDTPNERVSIDRTGGSVIGGSFNDNGAFQETGTFCWAPGPSDVGFHTLELTVTDNNNCENLPNTCMITIKVVCDFCPIRVYYENRAPDFYPLPALTVAGESITAGFSVDPAQQNGNVLTGNDPVVFRAPYVALETGFVAGPGFQAISDPNSCIETCTNCCENWSGFTVDTYDGGPLYNIMTPNGDGSNDRWEVDDMDHPYCAYGAMAYELEINSPWGPVYRSSAPWSETCCPFQSWSPSNNVISSIYWDGRANVGNHFCQGCFVSDSDYIYILTLYGCNGEITYTGHIQVVGSSGMVEEPTDPLREVIAISEKHALSTDSLELLATVQDSKVIQAILKMMPNPATDQLWLDYEPGIDRVWVADAAGRRVLELAPQGATTVTLDVHELAPASYLVEVLDLDGRVHKRKLIKQ